MVIKSWSGDTYGKTFMIPWKDINGQLAWVTVWPSGSNYKFRCFVDADGTGYPYSGDHWSTFNCSRNTKYRHEFKWDIINDLYEWRIDGQMMGNGSITGVAANWDTAGLLVGCVQGAGGHDAYEFLIDNVAFAVNGWNGADVWELGCTVLQANYTHTISVTGVSSDGLELTGDFSGQGSGYFDYGWAEYGGHKRMITNNDNTTVYLRYPINGLNDAACPTNVDFVAGCDKLQTTCDTKFDNMDRFLGFTKMPQDNPCMWTGE